MRGRQLSLADVTIGEADSVSDPELLMAIMETREALEDATTQEEVDAIRAANRRTCPRPELCPTSQLALIVASRVAT